MTKEYKTKNYIDDEPKKVDIDIMVSYKVQNKERKRRASTVDNVGGIYNGLLNIHYPSLTTL